MDWLHFAQILVDESAINVLYGLIESKSDYVKDIDWHTSILHNHGIDSSFIAIGADLLGNSLLLNLEDHQIYFLYHETDEIYWVAKSFNSFIKGLKREKPEYDKIEDCINQNKTTFFDKLLKQKNITINDLLLKSGIKAIFAATNSNNVFMLNYFVQIGGDPTGCLYIASGTGAIDCAKYLLSHGSDPNESDESLSKSRTYFKRTCLINASTMGYFEIVKLLIESGADPKLTDIHGQDALVWATRSGNQELIEYLKPYCQVS